MHAGMHACMYVCMYVCIPEDYGSCMVNQDIEAGVNRSIGDSNGMTDIAAGAMGPEDFDKARKEHLELMRGYDALYQFFQVNKQGVH